MMVARLPLSSIKKPTSVAPSSLTNRMRYCCGLVPRGSLFGMGSLVILYSVPSALSSPTIGIDFQLELRILPQKYLASLVIYHKEKYGCSGSGDVTGILLSPLVESSGTSLTRLTRPPEDSPDSAAARRYHPLEDTPTISHAVALSPQITY